jgi:hypothetical protein
MPMRFIAIRDRRWMQPELAGLHRAGSDRSASATELVSP